jgi:hypothetical protein
MASLNAKSHKSSERLELVPSGSKFSILYLVIDFKSSLEIVKSELSLRGIGSFDYQVKKSRKPGKIVRIYGKQRLINKDS